VAAGEVVFGAGVATRALAFFAAAPAGGRAARPFPELTDREVEILQLTTTDRHGWQPASPAFRLFRRYFRLYLA
jgi:hypothetical protein